MNGMDVGSNITAVYSHGSAFILSCFAAPSTNSRFGTLSLFGSGSAQPRRFLPGDEGQAQRPGKAMHQRLRANANA